MKLKFYVDSGANIHSQKSTIVDLKKDYNMTDEEIEALTDEDKYKLAEDWASNYLEIGYEEV